MGSMCRRVVWEYTAGLDMCRKELWGTCMTIGQYVQERSTRGYDSEPCVHGRSTQRYDTGQVCAGKNCVGMMVGSMCMAGM